METGITYIATNFFGNSVVEALCKEIINGTGRQMARVYLTGSGTFPGHLDFNSFNPFQRLSGHQQNSSQMLESWKSYSSQTDNAKGSEAMEATVKLSRQYFYEKDQKTPRINFIAREGSYHGNTIGALGISGHVGRRGELSDHQIFIFRNFGNEDSRFMF